ncbi:MAG: hypothetical protein LCH84_03295 [Gemmatimonadetes bacterium]|nr:hypothetical protein [Gemmatimonadota bacterium]
MAFVGRAVEDPIIEVQRYLCQLEQQAGTPTLHPADTRHQIASALWRAARRLDVRPAAL